MRPDWSIEIAEDLRVFYGMDVLNLSEVQRLKLALAGLKTIS